MGICVDHVRNVPGREDIVCHRWCLFLASDLMESCLLACHKVGEFLLLWNAGLLYNLDVHRKHSQSDEVHNVVCRVKYNRPSSPCHRWSKLDVGECR